MRIDKSITFITVAIVVFSTVSIATHWASTYFYNERLVTTTATVEVQQNFQVLAESVNAPLQVAKQYVNEGRAQLRDEFFLATREPISTSRAAVRLRDVAGLETHDLVLIDKAIKGSDDLLRLATTAVTLHGEKRVSEGRALLLTRE